MCILGQIFRSAFQAVLLLTAVSAMVRVNNWIRFVLRCVCRVQGGPGQ